MLDYLTAADVVSYIPEAERVRFPVEDGSGTNYSGAEAGDAEQSRDALQATLPLCPTNTTTSSLSSISPGTDIGGQNASHDGIAGSLGLEGTLLRSSAQPCGSAQEQYAHPNQCSLVYHPPELRRVSEWTASGNSVA